MSSSSKTKVLVVVLFLSLVGNFFLAGYGLGCFKGDDRPRHEIAAKDRKLHKHMSKDDRAAIKAVMKESRQEIHKLQKDLGNARRNVGQTLKAKDFDPEKLAAALEQEKQSKLAFLLKMREVRVKTLENISADGKKALQRIDREGFDFGLGNRPPRDKRDRSQVSSPHVAPAAEPMPE